MKKTLIFIVFNLFIGQCSFGQMDTVKFKRHYSYGFEFGYSASRWTEGTETTYANQSISDIIDRMFYFSNHGILIGGIFDYKPAKPFFFMETGVLLQQKTDIIYCVIPISFKIYMFQRHKTNLYLKLGLINDIGIFASENKFGNTTEGDINRYDLGINYGIGVRLNNKNNRKTEIWLRTSSSYSVTQVNEPWASGHPNYVSFGIRTLEIGLNYQIFKR